jgi:hypothetical protein
MPGTADLLARRVDHERCSTPSPKENLRPHIMVATRRVEEHESSPGRPDEERKVVLRAVEVNQDGYVAGVRGRNQFRESESAGTGREPFRCARLLKGRETRRSVVVGVGQPCYLSFRRTQSQVSTEKGGERRRTAGVGPALEDGPPMHPAMSPPVRLVAHSRRDRAPNRPRPCIVRGHRNRRCASQEDRR